MVVYELWGMQLNPIPNPLSVKVTNLKYILQKRNL